MSLRIGLILVISLLTACGSKSTASLVASPTQLSTVSVATRAVTPTQPSTVPSTPTLLRQFEDTQLCYSVIVPSGWQYVDWNPTAFGAFGPLDQPQYTISNAGLDEQATLEKGLSELKRGPLNSFIRSVIDWEVDGEPAFLLTLDEQSEFKFVAVMLTPDCHGRRNALYVHATKPGQKAFEDFLKHIHFVRGK